MLKKCLVLGVICLLMLVSVPTTLAGTEYYSNSIVLIAGKSNSTKCWSLWWKIGLYIPIVKRRFFIAANKEGESLSVLIFSLKSQFAVYIDNEDIAVDLYRARGVFYWGGKSLLFNHSTPPPVFALCRAKTVYVTT